MKVFIAVLALVGAVAANHIPEHVEIEKAVVSGAVPIQRGIIEDMKIIPVYAAPKFARDAYLPSEKYGIRGIFEKPVIVAFKNAEKNAMEAYLLKDGLHSAFAMPEYSYMRNAVLAGPAKVGLMLSAARFLDIPEMALSVPAIKMPVDATLATAFRMSTMENEATPWVFFTEKDSIRASMLEKLIELGQFNVNAEKLAIAREAPIAVRGLVPHDAILGESALAALPAGLRRAYLAESLEAEPAFEKLAPLSSVSSLSPLGGYHIVRSSPYRSYATAVPITSGVASDLASGIAATRAEAPVYHVHSLESGFPVEYAAHKHAKHFVPTLAAANRYYVQ